MGEVIGYLAMALIFGGACCYILFIRRDQFDDYADRRHPEPRDG